MRDRGLRQYCHRKLFIFLVENAVFLQVNAGYPKSDLIITPELFHPSIECVFILPRSELSNIPRVRNYRERNCRIADNVSASPAFSDDTQEVRRDINPKFFVLSGDFRGRLDSVLVARRKARL